MSLTTFIFNNPDTVRVQDFAGNILNKDVVHKLIVHGGSGGYFKTTNYDWYPSGDGYQYYKPTYITADGQRFNEVATVIINSSQPGVPTKPPILERPSTKKNILAPIINSIKKTMSTIHGNPPELCGFYGVLGSGGAVSNYEILGAVPPPPKGGATPKQRPGTKTTIPPKLKGNQVTKPKKQGGGLTRADHLKVRANARNVLKKTLASAAKSAASIQKSGNPNKRAAIHGAVLFGLIKKPMTAKQKAAVEKLQQATNKHQQATINVVKKTQNAVAKAQKLATHLKQHGNLYRGAAKKQPKTRIHGLVSAAEMTYELDPALAEMVNVFGHDAVMSHLVNVYGVLPAGDDGSAGDTGGGAPVPDIQVPTVDPTGLSDEGITTADPLPGYSNMADKDKMNVTFSTVPPGAVVYDGSKGWPSNGFVSWNLVYGGGDGYAYTDQPPQWQEIRGGSAKTSGGTVAQVAAGSAQVGWGPIIGNPSASGDASWVKGLHYAPTDDKFFWLTHDEAPSWATFEADMAAEATRKAAAEAAQAQAEAEAAQKAKDDAAKAEAKAQADAQKALQEETEAKEKAKSDEEWQREQDRAAMAQTSADAAAAAQREQAQLEIEKIRAANEVEMARLQAQQATQLPPPNYYGPSPSGYPATTDPSDPGPPPGYGDAGGPPGYDDQGGGPPGYGDAGDYSSDAGQAGNYGDSSDYSGPKTIAEVEDPWGPPGEPSDLE